MNCENCQNKFDDRFIPMILYDCQHTICSSCLKMITSKICPYSDCKTPLKTKPIENKAVLKVIDEHKEIIKNVSIFKTF